MPTGPSASKPAPKPGEGPGPMQGVHTSLFAARPMQRSSLTVALQARPPAADQGAARPPGSSRPLQAVVASPRAPASSVAASICLEPECKEALHARQCPAGTPQAPVKSWDGIDPSQRFMQHLARQMAHAKPGQEGFVAPTSALPSHAASQLTDDAPTRLPRSMGQRVKHLPPIDSPVQSRADYQGGGCAGDVHEALAGASAHGNTQPDSLAEQVLTSLELVKAAAAAIATVRLQSEQHPSCHTSNRGQHQQDSASCDGSDEDAGREDNFHTESALETADGLTGIHAMLHKAQELLAPTGSLAASLIGHAGYHSSSACAPRQPLPEASASTALNPPLHICSSPTVLPSLCTPHATSRAEATTSSGMRPTCIAALPISQVRLHLRGAMQPHMNSATHSGMHSDDSRAWPAHSNDVRPAGGMQLCSQAVTGAWMDRMEERLRQQGEMLDAVSAHCLTAAQQHAPEHATEEATLLRTLQEGLQTLNTAATATAAAVESRILERLWPLEAILEQALGELITHSAFLHVPESVAVSSCRCCFGVVNGKLIARRQPLISTYTSSKQIGSCCSVSDTVWL